MIRNEGTFKAINGILSSGVIGRKWAFVNQPGAYLIAKNSVFRSVTEVWRPGSFVSIPTQVPPGPRAPGTVMGQVEIVGDVTMEPGAILNVEAGKLLVTGPFHQVGGDTTILADGTFAVTEGIQEDSGTITLDNGIIEGSITIGADALFSGAGTVGASDFPSGFTNYGTLIAGLTTDGVNYYGDIYVVYGSIFQGDSGPRIITVPDYTNLLMPQGVLDQNYDGTIAVASTATLQARYEMTIDAGTLTVNGGTVDTSDLTIDGTAVMTAFGSVTGNLEVNGGGTLQVGTVDQPGALSVGSDFTVAGGHLLMKLGGPDLGNDSIGIGGSVDFFASDCAVTLLPGYTPMPGDMIGLIGWAGRYYSYNIAVSAPSFDGGHFNVVYHPQGIELDAVADPVADVLSAPATGPAFTVVPSAPLAAPTIDGVFAASLYPPPAPPTFHASGPPVVQTAASASDLLQVTWEW